MEMQIILIKIPQSADMHVNHRDGELVMTIPDKPNSKNQKYVTKK